MFDLEFQLSKCWCCWGLRLWASGIHLETSWLLKTPYEVLNWAGLIKLKRSNKLGWFAEQWFFLVSVGKYHSKQVSPLKCFQFPTLVHILSSLFWELAAVNWFFPRNHLSFSLPPLLAPGSVRLWVSGKCRETLLTTTDVVWRCLELNQCSVLAFEAPKHVCCSELPFSL